MRSFQHKHNPRRKVYLALSGSIEGQLREAFAKLNDAGLITQSQIAEKLGVHRSVISRRLMGRQNMTIEVIADMVWALNACIDVEIYSPEDRPHDNHTLASEAAEASLRTSEIYDLRSGSTSGNVIPILPTAQYGSSHIMAGSRV